MHSFEWIGNCGQRFDYPESPITTWWWQIENVVIGEPLSDRYSYEVGQEVLRLDASAKGVLFIISSPLFTANGTGKLIQGEAVLTGTLTPTKKGVRLLIDDSEPYSSWRPSARPDGPGKTLPLTARLVTNDGTTPAGLTIQSIEWRLTGTSTEPGIALNFPLDAVDKEFDITLEPGDVPAEVLDEKQRLKRSGLHAAQDSVLVTPHDWGGWSSLRVTAVLSDGTSIVGEGAESGRAEILIPRRRPDSNIATHWREETEDAVGYDLDDDEDRWGDGLTLYEEYRGFYAGLVHVAGAPGKRDLFVNDLSQLAALGCRFYAAAADVVVHCQLLESELPASKLINANHRQGAHSVEQHALIIKRRDEQPTQPIEGWTKVAGLTHGGPGRPGEISRIELFADVLPTPEAAKGTAAHELGHATNLPHHGTGDKEITFRRTLFGNFEEVSKSGVVAIDRIVDANGVEWTPSAGSFPFTEGLTYDLGAWHGQSSGGETCIMRYRSNVHAGSSTLEAVRYLVDTSNDTRSTFCVGQEGSSFNAGNSSPPSRFGSAIRGNDLDNIRISDRP